MEKLVLKSFLSPGDLLMLSAAIRDLHRAYPGRYLTDVRTSCPGLWDNNPYITRLSESDPEVRIIDCEYPLIHQCHRRSEHFIYGYLEHLNRTLGVNASTTEFRGDVHLSPGEAQNPGPLEALLNERIPYWILVAGGKFDFTAKWWDWKRYQQVVDHFQGRIAFVQVGEIDHYHPPLEGVIDFRKKTTVREIIRLTHYADGTLCPVTFLMHLAAAVPRPSGTKGPRPCVVVAGGREPPHWEAYPQHQFLHTVGALPCCAESGCWRARTRPLGDGSPLDHPDRICVDVVEDEPHCMRLITAEDVIRRIELYYEGGRLAYLTPEEAAIARRHARRDPFRALAQGG